MIDAGHAALARVMSCCMYIRCDTPRVARPGWPMRVLIEQGLTTLGLFESDGEDERSAGWRIFSREARLTSKRRATTARTSMVSAAVTDSSSQQAPQIYQMISTLSIRHSLGGNDSLDFRILIRYS